MLCRTRHVLRAMMLVLAAGGLAACATWRPLPLDHTPGSTPLAAITVDAAKLPSPALRAHPFDPRDGLDVTEVAMLAVAASPDLRVQRDQAGVAGAQAWAAGLLPDPQLSYARDFPTGHQPGTTVATTESLAIDLGNLVTRAARVKSAKASRREVDLNLLWSEWQTIAQARSLFDRVSFLRQRVARLRREQEALAPLRTSIDAALAAGDLSWDLASPGLNAAADVGGQRVDAEHQLHQADHDLHTLLGLDAAVPLHLTGAPFTVDPDPAQVQRALADMPRLRPDLLALQAGYRAQDERLRAAILAQFPAITVGFGKARDNSNITSAGFSIGLSLPLFDGNRGNIAVERATRQQLHDAYAMRVLTARNDVRQLVADLAVDRTRRVALARHAAQLDQARSAAQANYAAGRLDWPTWLAIRASALAADTALLTLDENIHVSAIALDALVGPWPTLSTASSQAPAGPAHAHQAQP